MILRQTLKRGGAAVVACMGLAGLMISCDSDFDLSNINTDTLSGEVLPRPLVLPTHWLSQDWLILQTIWKWMRMERMLLRPTAQQCLTLTGLTMSKSKTWAQRLSISTFLCLQFPAHCLLLIWPHRWAWRWQSTLFRICRMRWSASRRSASAR